MKHVDVIERLQRIRNFYRDTIEDYTAVEAVDMAISALKKQEEDRWILVTERLPENKKKVLVSYDTEDGKKVDISMFDKYGCLLGLVPAWRPLPEPYTEDKE